MNMPSFVDHCEKALVDEIIRRLVETYKPERVYFYGSRARGDHWERSDYDFMVIVSDDISKEGKARSRIQEVLAEVPPKHHYDVKVWTRKEFSRQLHLKASLPSRIMREGKLVYSSASDAEAFTWTGDVSVHLSMVKQPTSKYDPVLIELTSRWLHEARDSLWRAEGAVSESSSLLEGAMYHCQQAAQHALKGFLIWHDYPFRHSHELQLLCADSVLVDPTLDPLVAGVPSMAKWDMLGRHFTRGTTLTKGQAEEALMVVRHLYEAILQRLPEAAHPAF